EAVYADVSPRRQLADLWQCFDRDARRRMHGDVDGHKIGSPQDFRVEMLDREIDAIHDRPFALEQSCGFRETEWLTADFIWVYQGHPHSGDLLRCYQFDRPGQLA